MFTDVVKILESLLKRLHNMSSAEKSSHKKLGNQLLNLFLIIDNIVEQGKLLFTIIRKDKIVPLTFGITLLISIQESVKNLFDKIKHKSIEKIFKHPVPDLRKIQGVINIESQYISFDILQFIKTASQLKSETKKLTESTENQTDTNVVVLAQSEEKTDLNEIRKDLMNRNLSYIVIGGTNSQMGKAERLLDDIIRLSTELRSLIINEFDFDDIF